MGLVSVVVPVYNVEAYLNQCLDSIVNQTYKNIEVILVNDGSTDNSGEICDKYASKDSRIKVIHQENKGAAVAKNVALDNIHGDYFIFVDSDDYIDVDMIERVLNVLKNENVDVVEFGFINKYTSSEETVILSHSNKSILSVDEYAQWYIQHWTSSLLWNKLFKASLLKDYRFKKERRCIDDEFFTYKLMFDAQRVCILNASFYHYRKRKSSAVTSEKNQKQITKDVLAMLEERYLYVKFEKPNFEKTYLSHMLDFLLVMISSFKMDEGLLAQTVDLIKKYYADAKKFRLPLRFILLLKKTTMTPKGKLLKRNTYKADDTAKLNEYFD